MEPLAPRRSPAAVLIPIDLPNLLREFSQRLQGHVLRVDADNHFYTLWLARLQPGFVYVPRELPSGVIILDTKSRNF